MNNGKTMMRPRKSQVLLELFIELNPMLSKIKDGYFTTTLSSSLYASCKKESMVLLLFQILIHWSDLFSFDTPKQLPSPFFDIETVCSSYIH